MLLLVLEFTGESDRFRKVDRKTMQNKATERVCTLKCSLVQCREKKKNGRIFYSCSVVEVSRVLSSLSLFR